MPIPNQLENDCIKTPAQTLETKKEKIIRAIENNSNKTNFLKTIDEITKITGYTPIEISKTIEDSLCFVQSGLGQYTTRGLYEKFVPWYTKFLHSMKNKIN